MVVARPELARRRAAELRRSRRRRAPVPGRLSRRCAMAAGRHREELVRADQVAPVVPVDSGGRAAGRAGLADLRGPGFLTEPGAIKTAFAKVARDHGFDAAGIARSDSIP